MECRVCHGPIHPERAGGTAARSDLQPRVFCGLRKELNRQAAASQRARRRAEAAGARGPLVPKARLRHRPEGRLCRRAAATLAPLVRPAALPCGPFGVVGLGWFGRRGLDGSTRLGIVNVGGSGRGLPALRPSAARVSCTARQTVLGSAQVCDRRPRLSRLQAAASSRRACRNNPPLRFSMTSGIRAPLVGCASTSRRACSKRASQRPKSRRRSLASAAAHFASRCRKRAVGARAQHRTPRCLRSRSTLARALHAGVQ